MPKYTIELKEDDLILINVIKSIMNLKSIDKSLSFILNDYAKKNKYAEFIKARKKEKK